MKNKAIRTVLLIAVFFSVSVLAQVKMPLPVFTVVFALDGTIRSLSSGTTTPSPIRREGRPVTVMIDINDATGYALIMPTDLNGKIPTSITSSNAPIRITEGMQLQIGQPTDGVKADARHWYVVGSGNIRVVGWDIINNITPHN